MTIAIFAALLFIPSCFVWFLKINARSVSFPDWICDFFGDFRNYEASSCMYARFESEEHSLFYSQCRGRYIVIRDIFEKQPGLSLIAVMYIAVAGPLAFNRESYFLTILVPVCFILAPAAAFGLHRLAYQGRSRGEKLSSYELDEWILNSPKEEWLNSISAYLGRCSSYIHSCHATNIACVIVLSLQVAAVYACEWILL